MSMRRPLALPAAVAALGVAVLAYLGLTGFAFTDYDDEASRPVHALVGGHLHDFLTTAPAYGGSLLLRSPFALLPGLWGGGELAVYRLLAVPCLLAAMMLALVIVRTREVRVPGARWAGLVALLVAGNPITLRALEIGHPEELFGAVLCVGAVLAAIDQRPKLAGVLLGLAIGNKLWAVVAIAPVLLALEERRVLTATIGAGVAAALVLPFALAGGAAGGSGAGAGTGGIFQPWQLWWPLGHLGDVVRGIDGHIKPGYRTPPGWLGPIAHPMIAGLGVPGALAWVRLKPA
ncbi:MAG: hypothetical protein QOF76_3622, partial [Solirubrobacteraceae bacterium]|nr:hypothetical protein [Solirubrobacteraceae bacterium]